MASSENLATIDSWMYGSRTGCGGGSWFSGAFARETETVLTKALQKSLFNQSDNLSSEPIFPFVGSVAKTETVSVSGSGSEPETPGLKRRNRVAGGKITKRKSRASKCTTTTFIMADPANFRQMVQQVTGVKFGNGQKPFSAAPMLKPEPYRPVGMLPTLDTSACLLDRRASVVGLAFETPSLVADGGADFDFDSFPSFPTLESWN